MGFVILDRWDIPSQQCNLHQRCVCQGQVDKSGLAVHRLKLGHQIRFAETKIFFRSSSCGEYLLRESLEIRLEKVLNQEEGFHLSSVAIAESCLDLSSECLFSHN